MKIMIDVCLLGTAGMVPLKNRWLTSFYITSGGHSILIDCGEGTQIAMAEASCRLKPIDTICLTHFHADHVAGLAGLLLSMGNAGRTEDVTIIGPPGLANLLQCLLVIAPIPFKVLACETDGKAETELSCGDMQIEAFPVQHVIPCLGYQISLPRAGKFDPEKAKSLNIPVRAWSVLQSGEPVKIGDQLYEPKDVLGRSRPGLKIVYSTDTRPCDSIIHYGKDADLMILEGNYPDDEKIEKAKQWGHMTFAEAAGLAEAADAKELWLTHFSQSITDPKEYESNATKVFPNARVGVDGLKKTLNFRDEI